MQIDYFMDILTLDPLEKNIFFLKNIVQSPSKISFIKRKSNFIAV